MKEKYYRVAKTISRWKIDTPFENWLGSMADKSEFWKRVYVFYYWLFDHEYYVKGMPYLLKETERQNPQLYLSGLKSLTRDMIYSLHRFGASFEEYFVYQFYNLSAEGRSKYNTLKMQYGYCEQVNDADVREQFENKGKCYQLFRKYYKRDAVTYLGDKDRNELDEFMKKHTRFICKPLSGHSGQGVRIYEVQTDRDIERVIFEMEGGFVVEELIQQAFPMSNLHKESINTLRVVTFKTKKKVDIIGTALRMGTGHSFVDNAGAGGIYASVNIEEGIVDSIALDNAGNHFIKHPDSSVVLPGFKIPSWQEAITLTKNMANEIPGATMIAWDLAYSERGWCMVEGNDVGEAYLYQAPRQIGMKEKILRKIDEYVTGE